MKDAKNQFDVIGSALSGERGSSQLFIASVGADWLATMLAKNADYGSSIFAKKSLARASSLYDRILVRMDDKINRLYALAAKNGEGEVNESFDDTVKDLGAYCLLYLVARMVGEAFEGDGDDQS